MGTIKLLLFLLNLAFLVRFFRVFLVPDFLVEFVVNFGVIGGVFLGIWSWADSTSILIGRGA